jgi:hypothetical protein
MTPLVGLDRILLCGVGSFMDFEWNGLGVSCI